MLREANAWLCRHPWRADGLLAAALLLVSGPQLAAGRADGFMRAAFVVVNVLIAGLVVPRRRYPVATFTAGAAIVVAQVALGVRSGPNQAPAFVLQPTNADLAIPVLLYTLAAYRPRPVSIAGLAVCLLGAVTAIARWAPAHQAYAGDAVLGAALGLGGVALAAWVLGDSVAYRYRRAYYAALERSPGAGWPGSSTGCRRWTGGWAWTARRAARRP